MQHVLAGWQHTLMRVLLSWPVSRFKCRSDLYEMDLLIDINVDVYPVEVRADLLASCHPIANSNGFYDT